MSELRTMRASDRDREQVVERLRDAFGEGRLTLAEYLDRMESASQATTYGDLAAVCADLPSRPATATPPSPSPSPSPSRSRGPATARDALAGFAGLPAVLRVLWTFWLVAVSVNVVVWVLVSATHGHLAYPWPLWVAGPYGAVLFAISAATIAGRRARCCGGAR